MIEVKFLEDEVFNCSFTDEQPFVVDFGSSASEYMGTYEVTPSSEQQTLLTANKLLEENVVIHPIPSNYGLITYNGDTITVS